MQTSSPSQVMQKTPIISPRTCQIIAGLILGLATVAAPTSAQDAGAQRHALPPLADDVATDFQAIGRFGQAGFRTRQVCTATLIAPTLIVTAAHCASPTGHSGKIFVAGWSRGDHIAASGTILELRHPAYAIDSRHRPQNDIALVVLKAPINDVDPIPLGEVLQQDVIGTDVGLLGYHTQTPHLLSGRFDCPLTYFGDGLLLVGCPVIGGNSGSPILNQSEDGGWQVVGIVSSTVLGGAVAVALPDWIKRELARHLPE